ncbi:MAG: peptide deformylase [candidate division Zixibacteria bacterium]
MAERPIVIYGDPVLREESRLVEKIDQETKDLVSDMTDTLKEARGLGLAAVQIGVLKRVFIVDLQAIDVTSKLHVFINPEIIETTGEIELEEGCLSFPGIYQKVVRPSSVRFRALNIDGESFEMSFDGMAARAVLHEYDHLDGKLFIDYLSSVSRSLLRSKLRRLNAAS